MRDNDMMDLNDCRVENVRVEDGNVAVDLVWPDGVRTRMVVAPKVLAQLALKQLARKADEQEAANLLSLPAPKKPRRESN